MNFEIVDFNRFGGRLVRIKFGEHDEVEFSGGGTCLELGTIHLTRVIRDITQNFGVNYVTSISL